MFSLINVEVSANLHNYESAMQRAADVADRSMSAAAANADNFQTAFDRAASASAASADVMASRFESANDAVAQSAEKSADAINKINEAAEKVDTRSWHEKVSKAVGEGLAAGAVVAQSWLDKVEEWAKGKLMVIGIALAAGVSIAAVSAIYAAYKVISASVGFISGLFSGESYKSQDIDALIKTNDEVKKLQENLHVAAVEASALNEAIKAQGVNPDAYVATWEKSRAAMHANGEELDRLGVKYKDSAGNLLPVNDFLENVRQKLGEYTEGWDRAQAAQAIGAGSEREIDEALKVTAESIEKAKERLIDYTLVIGDRTQEAVQRYEDSRRAFDRELDLTSQGFKRAFADQIMPLLTDLSDFFRDGFPGVVRAFRYSMATLTSLFYGLKEAVYVVTESILESFLSIGDVVSRVSSALVLAMTGHFKEAWAELKAVPDDLEQRWKLYFDNVVAMSKRNVDAMALAWGADSLTVAEQQASKPHPSGKSWEQKPDTAKTVAVDANRAVLDGQLRALERAVASEAEVLRSREDMLKEFHDRGAMTLEDYYKRRTDIENEALRHSRAFYAQEIVDIQDYQSHYEKGSREWVEAANRMQEVRDKLLKLDQQAASASTKLWLEQSANDAVVGADKALQAYKESAGYVARNVSSAWTNAFRSMEDAIVRFTTTGKLSFRDLANGIISDLVRIAVQESIMKPLAGAFSGSGVTSAIASFFGYSSGSAPVSAAGASTLGVPSYDVGTLYVPSDQLAMVHKGEAIIPADLNRAGLFGGANVQINVTNQAAADGYQARTTTGQGADGATVINLMVERVEAVVSRNIQRGVGLAPTLERRYGLNAAVGAGR